jgi:hypothetical protein
LPHVQWCLIAKINVCPIACGKACWCCSLLYWVARTSIKKLLYVWVLLSSCYLSFHNFSIFRYIIWFNVHRCHSMLCHDNSWKLKKAYVFWCHDEHKFSSPTPFSLFSIYSVLIKWKILETQKCFLLLSFRSNVKLDKIELFCEKDITFDKKNIKKKMIKAFLFCHLFECSKYCAAPILVWMSFCLVNFHRHWDDIIITTTGDRVRTRINSK